MAIKRIRYTEPDTSTYEAVEINYADDQEKVFDSGDFVRDWYFLLKWIILEAEFKNEPLINSSSIDHFIMDGAPYDSAYLVFDNDEPQLAYAKDCWDDCIDEGIEFFVARDTKPTWEELREICGDPKKEE
jgi:hypothetical protein